MNIPYHPSRLEINVDQLKKNIGIIRKYLKNTLYCFPVKANAYGHGMDIVSKAAEESNVDFLAVACLREGIALREFGIKIPIIVFGAFHEHQIESFIDHDLQFTISSLLKAQWVLEKCNAMQKKCSIHLEVDTGIQRTGVRPSTAMTLLDFINSQSCFNLVGIYSHFATADSPNDPFAYEQIQEFNKLSSHPIFKNKNIIWHLANSGGTAYYPESHFNMVRPSLLTFGYLPDSNVIPKGLEELAPCLTLKSQVSYFKVVEAGKGISYGHTYVTKKQSRIVTVPVGYGDGYPRALSNIAEVLIRGKRYPIAGTICMDQFMVDIGDDEVFVGEEVVLIGKQGKEYISAVELATLCNTNPREIFCSLNNRLERKVTMQLCEALVCDDLSHTHQANTSY